MDITLAPLRPARLFSLLATVVIVTLAVSGTSDGEQRGLPMISAAEPASALPPAEIRKAPPDPFDVLVAALTACSNRLPLRERERLARIIATESEEHGYDPLFITALMQVESGCRATANGGGAIGLVQLMPETARQVARRIGLPWRGLSTLTEPASNIQIGVRYLREMEEMFNDPFRAMAAYNMGPVRAARMSRARARQTTYVRKVLSRYERLLEQFT